MNLTRILGKLKAARFVMEGKVYPSFSQAGEDQIVRYLLEAISIKNPSFLDIGANHPIIGNNTFLFYSRGASGVCIEPDPTLFKIIRRTRKRDIVLNVGIGSGVETEGELYVFPDPYSGWNTFSKVEAQNRQLETGIMVRSTVKVPLLNINSLVRKYFKPWPNFISIDVEGLDLEILKSIDFENIRPEVICVETISFSMKHEEKKTDSIIQFLQSKDYFVFGDSHINTIFCRNDVYNLT